MATQRTEDITAWANAEPVRARLLERYGVPAKRRPIPVEQRFSYLARSIAYQQLATKAATSIWLRVADTLGDAVSPESILAVSFDQLRAAGLSRAKVAAITDLSERTITGELRLGRLGTMDDDEVVARLTTVRGIGPWTAHMFLISALGREDIWPVADYGVRSGVARAWGLVNVPSEREMSQIGEVHKPFRSILARWSWNIVDDPDNSVFPPISAR